MVNLDIEKYAIFSENFRGLPNGWHNLRRCNFLVGENSTGKSSFLQLIELMDSREHLMLLEVLGAVDGLDSVFDVCSRISGSKETTIGFLIKECMPEGEEARVRGRIITYKAVKGDFQIERMTVLNDSVALRLKRGSGRISFRYDTLEYHTELSQAQNGRELEKLHNQKSKRFSKHREVDWNSQPDNFCWLDALLGASSKESGISQYSIVSFPPLRCLSHGPMRTKTSRVHHGENQKFSSTGEHTPFRLRDVYKTNPEIARSIDKFGKVSGLFDEIAVNTITTKVKDKPFVLQVKKSGKYFYVDELGFGVGQILPIIADISVYPEGTSFLIQQPELHLHPKAQASLGELFYNAANDGSALVIETHSDFVIDRFRMAIAKGDSEMRSQLIYFDKTDTGENVAYEIEINGDGSYSEIPDSFRSFFVRESIDKFELL